MPTFNFDDGTALASTASQASMTLTVPEDGVNFTFSVTNAHPTFDLISYSPTPDTVFMSNGSVFAGTVFTIDATGAGQTQFMGNATTPVAISVAAFNGNYQVRFIDDGGTATVTKTIVAGTGLIYNTVTAIGQFSEIQFTPSQGFDQLSINSLQVAAINCFCADTHIATPDGERLVQDLVPGDRILTANGSESTVKWLGKQEIDTRLNHPADVNPVCIEAGALADGVPARDLYISGGHALEIDGILYNAGALVNGRSITWVKDMPRSGFEYFHIDTGAHELIVAENCAVESYLDVGDLGSFENAAERPEGLEFAELDMLRVSSARIVPERVATRLLERAGGRMDEEAA